MNAALVSGAGDANAGIEQAIQLLKEALAILDKSSAPAEIGARLQEIIAAAQDLV